MDKKSKGFTLVEVILALTIIGVVAAIALASSNLPQAIKEKRIAAMSKDFYMLTENIYLTFLNHPDYMAKTKNGYELGQAFIKRAGAKAYSACTTSPISGPSNSNSGNYGCIYFPEKKLIASIYLTTSCSTTYSDIKEYYTNKNETSSRTSKTNSCGYITYGFKDSKTGLGSDVFKIALGANSIK